MSILAQQPEQQHLVARCLWDSVFDDEEGAYQLQEYLSDFSTSLLGPIIEQVFEQYNPPGQTWRIKQLTLDLGSLDHSELKSELPRRISRCLSEQLQQLKRKTRKN